MICIADACESGKIPCTRLECGYGDVLDERDRRAAIYHAAMHRRIAPGFWPRDAAEAADTAIATPETAMHLAKRLGLVALLIAAVGAAWLAAWHFPGWPWLVAWLGSI